MKHTKLSIAVFAIIGLLILLISSCKYGNVEGRFETEIFNKAKSTDGYVWFKYSAISLQKSAGSGHEQPLLKIILLYNRYWRKNFLILNALQNGWLLNSFSLLQ